jgi:hypothetical protein
MYLSIQTYVRYSFICLFVCFFYFFYWLWDSFISRFYDVTIAFSFELLDDWLMTTSKCNERKHTWFNLRLLGGTDENLEFSQDI